uniref:Uncharacterized protein n=1 Tax=Panagrolaimus superbus TaxID=310955 RepID=A0A914Y6P3_9BILA
MDESRFPKGSDEAFFQRSNINHLDKSIYCKPRTKDKFEFGIRHFAGITYYNVEGFLANNRWTELTTIFDLLNKSENPSIAFFIPKASGIVQKNRTVYVADEFSKAVSQLYERLNKESIHFIRCIRVNSDQTSTKFDAEVIGRQMKALSIQEIYRMSVLGYPHKINIQTFIKSFRCLLPVEVIAHEGPEKIAEDILNAQGTRYFGDYAIGSHSVFLKDRLLNQLEDLKHALRDSSAILIQRNIRKFAAKKKFERKKQSAVKIQSAFRGWNARKKAVNLKEEEFRQVEGHAENPILQESLIIEKTKPDDNVVERVAPSAPVQWYELPEEINTILNQEAINLPKVKTITNYLPLKLHADIPMVEALTIEEFAELNLKNHILEARREPILTPFLPKEEEKDFKLSCEIFKLILRYMNDTKMTPGQRSILAKYIIQQGIEVPSQRDEIFMQLCNQTYNNRNPENSKTAWNLILMAVNSFPPGILIFPMIKDYFERQPRPLSTHLLNGLFRSLRHNDTNRKRTFASTTLEQQSYYRRQTPVVQIILPDGDSIDVEVDAWSTIEEIVERVLRLRGLSDSEGWGLTIDNGEINSVVHGHSFLFDAISQFEIPSVPPEDSPFLNFRTISKSKSQHKMRNAQNVMESLSPKPNNGILKSNNKLQRLTPEEYANMSVASRIRNMKIPGNNGDVNKFLDEVFDQALPSNEDNSTNLIAASIKGGAGPDPYYQNRPTEIYRRAPPSPRYNGAVSDVSDRRHVPSGLSSSINLSADDGRDSRFSGSLPPSRQLFSPSRRSNDRARTPTNMMENSRLGQIQPTSQHARYVGNGSNNSNGGSMINNDNRQNGRRRFESPAAERRARAFNNRSKSTPRGFTNGDYPAPILPPPDYDQNDTYTIKRVPRQFPNGNNNYPRSVSSTPRAARNGFVRAEESPRFARQQSYELGSPHYMTGDARRSPTKSAALHSPHFLDNIDLNPRSPIYSYRNDTINRSRASAEPTYFENSRTLSRNGVNGTLPRKTPDSIVSNGHHHNENNGIYSRDMNKSYHEPSISGPPKSAMSLISAKSQSSSNIPATCFISEPWKLIIRREVFFPGETLDDIDSIDLVFSQIISDCRKHKPHRIRHFERDRINSILNEYRVPVESLDKPNEVSIEVKQDIISEARKWPLYFSRMYPAIEERNNERVFMILGVSENGIRLMTRNIENVNDPMVPQAHFE